MQDNLFANSGEEHSAYFSDGSDDYVIRRNVFAGSNASGLQINVVPREGGNKFSGQLNMGFENWQTNNFGQELKGPFALRVCFLPAAVARGLLQPSLHVVASALLESLG